MTVLETKRLFLRKLTANDADFILGLVNDPAWLQHIGDRGVRNLDDARAYILNGAMKSYEQNGFGLYLVETKLDHVPIGICGLVKREGLDDIDIGFALLPAHRSNGYAFEAAAATLVHARRELGLTRVVAITSPHNTTSIALLEKLGMRFDKMVRLSPDGPESSLFATTSAVTRPARLDEAAALADLADRTFRDTYTAVNTPEDMRAHVARSFSPALQTAELNDPAMSTIVAAMPDGALVGFAQLRSGPAPACVPQIGALEVWRFYVDREHHGQGIAQQLMNAALETAAQRHAAALWLGVWERNWRARAFYAKCGFKDVGTQIFVLGNDPQTDRVLLAKI